MVNRDIGLEIWQAGVDAVRSDRLVTNSLKVEGRYLSFGRDLTASDAKPAFTVDMSRLGKVLVVGAGKAGAGMVSGVEQILDPIWNERLSGWVNVPADCVGETHRIKLPRRIKLHGARPAGRNEPTEAGIEGSREILRRVNELDENDLCICLISGGGSALLPALREGVSLADLQLITKTLSAAGATIQQLNALRKRLSTIQGGQLVKACGARQLVALIISDVMGDPLSFIASGPTVEEEAEPAILAALDVFDEFELESQGVRPELRSLIEGQLKSDQIKGNAQTPTHAVNIIIGNNDSAVAAAKRKAEALGFEVQLDEAQRSDATAEDVGQHLAVQLLRLKEQAKATGRKQCFISGGEPIVRLAPAAQRGKGGRNQQLALAAFVSLMSQGEHDALTNAALLSGGTDGEDGPTDAAGGLIDQEVVKYAGQLELDALQHLERNDAYPFLEQSHGLIKTGPTHTNVCDLRVIVVSSHATR